MRGASVTVCAFCKAPGHTKAGCSKWLATDKGKAYKAKAFQLRGNKSRRDWIKANGGKVQGLPMPPAAMLN